MNNGKKGLWLVIILLLLCVIGLGSYVVYDKFFDEKLESEKVEEKGTEDKTDSKIEKVNLSKEDIDKLGAMLFSKIDFDTMPYFGGYPLIEATQHMNKNEAVLFSLRAQYKYENYFDYVESYCEIGNKDERCRELFIDKNTFRGEYYNLFGKDAKIDYDLALHDAPGPYGSDECYFENQDVVCYATTGGVGSPGDSCYGRYTLYDTILEGENIILHVKPEAYFCEEDIDPVLYASRYGSGEYKITFKQDSIGNWYWYSSEAVNK